jgi:carboxypeptidase D
MQDFNYLHSNAFEITIELSCCKYPSAAGGNLEKEWDNNKEALLTYMEMVNEFSDYRIYFTQLFI